MPITDRLPGIDTHKIDAAEMVLIDHGNGIVEVIKDRWGEHPKMMPLDMAIARLRGHKRSVAILWVPIANTKPE